MVFYDKIKAFLGLPTNQDQRIIPDTNRSEKNPCKQYDNHENETSSDFSFNRGDQHFNIFSDPLEMSRYFEQQMDEMLKSFGFGNFSRDFPFGQFGENFGLFNNQLEDDDGEETGSSEELRNRFLKPGYEGKSHGRNQTKEDKDMDGKVDISDLGKIFDGNDKRSSIIPHEQLQSFSKNIITSTIMSPDGSIETRNTFRDSQGNEETQITRKKGDKEYTIIKRIDKGRETITENFINIDKDEVEKYFPSRNDNKSGVDPSNWGFFNRFF